MVVDAGDNFALLCIRVGGDGEVWAFDGGANRFGCRCAWERDGRRVNIRFGLGVGEIGRNGGRIHKCDGGGTELCLGRDDFDGAAEDSGVGLDRGRHSVVVWKCCCRWDLRERMETLRFFRPLLSCSEGANGFFR